RGVPALARRNSTRLQLANAPLQLRDLGLDRDAQLRQIVELRLRLVELTAPGAERELRLILLANERLDLLLQLRHARAEGDDDAREIFVLALDGVDVAGRGLDVDARLRGDVGHLFERRARDRQFLFVDADLFVRRVLVLLQARELFQRRVAARDELRLLLGVQRRFFRRDGEILFESLQLRERVLALAAPLAKLLLRAARPLLGNDARVVRGAQLVLD